MKTENKPTNNSKNEGVIKHYAITILMFSLIVIAVLAGVTLLGVPLLPKRAEPYVGGALLGYVVVGGAIVTHLCAKTLLNRKG